MRAAMADLQRQGGGFGGGSQAQQMQMMQQMLSSMNFEDADLDKPLKKCPDTGLTLPPWTPAVMREKIFQLPLEQRKQICDQQAVRARTSLGLPEGSVVDDEVLRRWMKQETVKMKQMKEMLARGGPMGGHGHDHSHGGHGHDHGHGHGGHGGHGHDHGGHGGHSHGGVPCQGHGHGGGPGHAQGSDDNFAMPSVFNLISALEIPPGGGDPDLSAPLKRHNGIVLAPWLPPSIISTITGASEAQQARVKKDQIVAVIECAGGESNLDDPAWEPSEEQYRKWMLREWAKMKMSKSQKPPSACLEGRWVYGRRPDGELSHYHIRRSGSAYDFREAVHGDSSELRGTVTDASESKISPPGNFAAQWKVELADGKGVVWIRLNDPATIHSVFQGPNARGGFRAVARRGWSTFAVTGDAEEEVLSGQLDRDKETGLLIPSWTPARDRERMQAMDPEARRILRKQQDAVIRQALGLKPDEPVTEELQVKWLRGMMKESKRRPVILDGPPQELPIGSELRFPVGAEVLCNTPAGWKQATVVKHWWPLPNKPDVAAPYQLRLAGVQGQMSLIFAPYDDDRFVTQNPQVHGQRLARAAQAAAAAKAQAKPLRFPVSTRVMAKTAAGWKKANVIAHWATQPGRPEPVPYQLLLDDADVGAGERMLWAPVDDDACVKKFEEHADPAADDDIDKDLAAMNEMLMQNLSDAPVSQQALD
eukprot:TRINITY_DN40519_c0_g1_i1.p1 TRINITY_DN40519_c0_g1~~TRINITY_DN40519_c0_g1_i1.p1  ORF type:complete len:733 (+),score=171.14 TRINITY_DN40519_c0_g1_i1:82-2199(+)